jgi:ribonuclease HI
MPFSSEENIEDSALQLVIYTDGGSRGNPGPSAIGVCVQILSNKKTEIVAELSETIGIATNNVAEYKALLKGLKTAVEMEADSAIFYLDSRLVVEQMQGNWQIKNEDLKRFHKLATGFTALIPHPYFRYIPREKNIHADWLVNHALDFKQKRLKA